jgi:hypothetical protein
MNDPKTAKPIALDLEVQEIEQYCNPGCSSSSTNPRCTCPSFPSTTGSLFTARTAS